MIRDEKHLKFIRRLPCVTCNRGNSQAAHIRKGSGAGIGQKPDDSRVVPLCDKCHHTQHNKGEITFWRLFGGYEGAAILAHNLYTVSGDTIQAMREIVKWQSLK